MLKMQHGKRLHSDSPFQEISVQPMMILLRTLLPVFIGGVLCLHEAGQIAPVSADESTDTQTETPGDPAARLEAERKAVSENTGIDDATRARIDELYGKAILRIGDTTANDARRQQLIKELESLSSDTVKVQSELDGFSPTETANLINAEADSETVAQQLNDARTQATARRVNLDAVTAEINSRAERRTQIPSLRIQTQQSLDAVGKELTAAAPPDELTELTAARRALLQVRKRFLQSQLALLEQESQTYESTVRLSTARRDLAERYANDADNVVAAIQERLSEVRRTEASAAAQQARIAAANAHPAVADVATRNAALAEEIQNLLQSLERTQEKIDQATELRDSLENEFRELQKRAELAGFSQAIGVLLRLQRNRIPDSAPYAARAHERADAISDINLRLIEWESERDQIVDTDEAVERELATVTTALNEFEKAAIAFQLRQMLAQSKQLLSKAIEEVGRQYLDRLVTLDSLERELTAVTGSQATYIAEHVLWVRSAEPVGMLAVRNAWDGSVKMLTQPFWEDAYRQLAGDIVQQPVMWAAFALLFIWLLFVRERLRTAIRDDGQAAARSNCTTIQPTLRAILDSTLLAALCPALVWFVGWRMTSLTAAGLTQAIGSAFQSTAFMWFGLELLRQLIRTGGVFELHFGWPHGSLHVVRQWLGITMFLTIPACWVLLVCEGQDDEILHAGPGRLAFAFCTLVVAIGLVQVLRGNGTVARDISMRSSKTLLGRTRPLWSAMSIIAPVVLTVLSLSGYQYSALQMSKRVLATNGLICLLAVAFFLLNRWLLVTYRRIAIEQNRQRREALIREAAAKADEEGGPQSVETETVPTVSLADVNQQTRKLIQVSTGVFGALGVWLIWIDVLPALGILRSFELWPNQIAAAVNSGDGAIPPMVTLADLTLAIGGGILTIVAARNLPGLLEITILQRLPLDAGTRYAASSLTRYLIAVIGITLSFWLIGIGWSSLQWLIAAMTVGLGFGLQEIFANFVSGLILLFERPVRIGDTVTVNNITGTVSRIRIRATTILDWDNKELIVPNRAFITDNLINWTLTNPDLRMILRVGIAYGSDTRLATELLYQVANENELVLHDPEPAVVFTEFGDSSLNFELRVFVSGLTTYRRLQHELNISIDNSFRNAGIEIAFPQRDLHVRTLPKELLQRTDDPAGTAL
jgi:potassium efflux system protein